MRAGTGLRTIHVAGDAPSARPVFFFDLADPGCYLAAERIIESLPIVPEWEPVHGPRLGISPPPLDAEELAEAVGAAGLQPLRVPPSWPLDSRLAMLTATYAKGGGRVVAFSLAAFRQTFAAGRDLADEATVLLAAAASEMHPRAVLRAVKLRSVSEALESACGRARAAGVRSLPAIKLDGTVIEGPDAVELAAATLGRGR